MMVKSACCPNNSELPSKLNVEVGVWEHYTGECYTANFMLKHSGGEWEGQITNQVGTLHVRLWCDGDGLEDFKGELTVSVGSGCQNQKLSGSGADSCDSFRMSFGGNLPPDCCGRPAGTLPLDVGVVIWDGPPVPDSFPIPVLPPCQEVFPEECCPTPGQTPSSSTTRKACGARSCGPVGNTHSSCCHLPVGDYYPEGGSTPECGCKTRQFSEFPIRYATGEIALSAVDIDSGGYGVPWGHTRSFASRKSHAETLGNGFNWHVEQWPYLVIDGLGNVVLQGAPNTAYWFDKQNGTFIGRFGIKQTLELDSAAQVYRFFNLDGSYVEFDSVTGMFERHVDPAGNKVEVTEVEGNGYNITKVDRTYTSEGTTTLEQYFYDYDNSTGDDLLSTVTLRRQVDGGAWQNVARANYAYYGENDSHGRVGDLQTVTTQSYEDGQWKSTGTTMYRYYIAPVGSSSSSSSSSSSGTPSAAPHLLKYVINPASYQRLADDPSVTDPLTASDVTVSQYADFYFQYDAQHRVVRESVQGGSRTYTFGYSESEFADGYNAWKYKTVETLPGGDTKTVYSNYAGQMILQAFTSGTEEWLEFWKYSDDGQVILHAQPSALSGYDEQYADLLNETGGSYQYMKDSEGFIEVFEYDSVSKFLSAEKIKEGENGTEIKLREYAYTSCEVHVAGTSSSSSSSSSSSAAPTPRAWFMSKRTEYPSDTDQTKIIVTTFSYTFHNNTCRVKQKTTTWPVVSTDQNGSGTADTRKEVFDTYGNNTWLMDERGFMTRNSYDIPTGAVTEMIQDVDTSQVSNEPAGWETPTGGGLNLITDFEHDGQGRPTQILGPVHTIDINGVATSVRRAIWIVYKDADHEVWTAQGYATGENWGTFTLINPVSITKRDEAGMVLEEILATRASTSGKLSASDTFPQSSYVRWTTYQYTECCLLTSKRVYHTIPASGEGSEGTNYDQEVYGYDSRKRKNRNVTGEGTITRTVLDARSNPLKVYVGTDDTGATASDPTGSGATGNNMVLFKTNEYDDGTDGGDNNLTKATEQVDASTTRVTSYTYDWRNRRTDVDGEIDLYEKATFDNFDRAIKTDRYDTTSSGNLIGRSETKFDDRGRVYQTIRYAVDPSTGTVGNSLIDNTWFDSTGNVIKSLPAGSSRFIKSVFDGLGRQTKKYRGFDIGESTYAEAQTVTGDTIMRQMEMDYDAASNVIETRVRRRYHNATGTGELNGPDTVQPKARVSYSASWQDALGRTIATADYGTNGGSSLTRPSTIPARSDDVLVSSSNFDSAGYLEKQMNPAGIVSCFYHDAVGREIRRVMNCITSSSSSSSSSSSGFPDSVDTNVEIRTTYNADGNVTHITAVNSQTGNQTTEFVYGTTVTDSDIASTLLKTAEIYPDSVDSSDRVTFKYNRQGQVREKKDQNGTVHTYDFDKLGRQTHDRVTTLGTGISGGVRRISQTFEVRGMIEKITSYDGETVGSGTIVNEAQFAYNNFGQLITDYQAHSGAVNTSNSPKVQYGYASGSANTIRPTSLTYPDGRVLTYGYGASDSIADALSRVAALIDDDPGSTHLADYSYLGEDTFVEVDYTEPDVKYTLIGTAGGNDPDTGDFYRGLDRFGRVKDSYWRDYGSSTDVDRIKYGYDRNGNRLWRENTVAASLSKNFDELYGYDLIDRLKTMDRGDLGASKDSISSLNFAQDWSLDATGNWRRFREDDDGAGWDLEQTRTANKVNEITDITESTGPSWVTPVYDKAGNMTTIPKPADPTIGLTATYDAWNRLVKVEESGNTVAEYAYDGAKRRTVKKTYSGGALDQMRHFYFTEPAMWQVIEERVDGSSDPERQFVWGQRYIDDMVLRDRDTTGDGLLDERLYGMQDANWNVTGVVDTAGAVQERYAYSAYGDPVFMDASFETQASSSYEWGRLFAGYEWDSEVGWYAVRHRLYVPVLGWGQRDPLGLGPGLNLYLYADAAPLNSVDPSGLWFRNAVCAFAESRWTSCFCFIITTIDSIAGLVMPFLQTLTPPIGQTIQGILSILDCSCDIVGVVGEWCQGCLSIGEIGAAAGSCLVDAASIILRVPNLDRDIVFGMLEFIFYVITQALAGHGIGAEICPPGLKACLDIADDFGVRPQAFDICQ